MPVRSSSRSSMASVPWVLEGPGTSFDVMYVVSEGAGAFWSLNVARIVVLDRIFGGGAAVNVDDVAIE